MSSRATRSASLLILAIAAMALYGCALVPRLQTPRLSIVDIEVHRASFLEQRLQVRVRVENPNDRSLPVRAISYTIYVGGQQFATGASDAGFVVPALGTAEFNMDVTANVAGTLFAILGRPRGQPIEYHMKGTVALSRGWLRSIPFEERGTFTLR